MIVIFFLSLVLALTIFSKTFIFCREIVYGALTANGGVNNNDEADGMYVQKDGEVRVDG